MNNYTLKLHKYTEVEQKALLKSIIILIDSREQKNSHITNYFQSKDIKFEVCKLDFCDYSFVLPASSDLGIMRNMYFDKQIAIERKNSLEELSSNLTTGRDRFNDEFLRSGDTIKHIIVESGSWHDIIEGKYNTQFNKASYFASLLSFQSRYNLHVNFIDKDHSGQMIFGILYYYFRGLIA